MNDTMKEPTADEIREALEYAEITFDRSNHTRDNRCAETLSYISSVLLADPERVRALLALTKDDLLAAGANAYDRGSRTRCFAACNLHPDAKGGAK